MENFKISSLHDDLAVPFEEKGMPDYDPKKNYPERYDSIGEKGERSALNIVKQFGITESDIRKAGVENPSQITEVQYGELLKSALEKQYDTVFASVYAEWEDIPNQQEQIKLIQRISGMYKNWGTNLILRGEDFAKNKNKPNMLMTLEGADCVRELADIDKLYEVGIRGVVMQYGGDNALANGEGLTQLGSQAVEKFLDLQIIVDLAHAFPITREQIIKIAENRNKGNLLAYTHGANVSDIAKDAELGYAGEKRGIRDDEIKKIISLGGIIGLSVTRPFFQSIDQIAQRIDAVCQIENGPQSVAIGSDFGGVSSNWDIGILKPNDMLKIGDVLSEKFGYNDNTIKNILERNVPEWTKKVLSE